MKALKLVKVGQCYRLVTAISGSEEEIDILPFMCYRAVLQALGDTPPRITIHIRRARARGYRAADIDHAIIYALGAGWCATPRMLWFLQLNELNLKRVWFKITPTGSSRKQPHGNQKRLLNTRRPGRQARRQSPLDRLATTGQKQPCKTKKKRRT